MPRKHRPTRLVGLVIAITAALSTAGCGSKTQQAAVPSAVPPVPYVVKVTTVTGKLSHRARATVRTQAGRIIHAWWNAAYLTSGHTHTFGAFTPGAAKLAERDADLMSDSDRGSATALDVKRSGADLDVLGVKGRPVGITAHLDLVYDKTTKVTSRCRVGGTVSLRPTGRSWRIFGYDVTRTCHPRKAGS